MTLLAGDVGGTKTLLALVEQRADALTWRGTGRSAAANSRRSRQRSRAFWPKDLASTSRLRVSASLARS